MEWKLSSRRTRMNMTLDRRRGRWRRWRRRRRRAWYLTMVPSYVMYSSKVRQFRGVAVTIIIGVGEVCKA